MSLSLCKHNRLLELSAYPAACKARCIAPKAKHQRQHVQWHANCKLQQQILENKHTSQQIGQTRTKCAQNGINLMQIDANCTCCRGPCVQSFCSLSSGCWDLEGHPSSEPERRHIAGHSTDCIQRVCPHQTTSLLRMQSSAGSVTSAHITKSHPNHPQPVPVPKMVSSSIQNQSMPKVSGSPEWLCRGRNLKYTADQTGQNLEENGPPGPPEVHIQV